jgi:lipoate-protein ligase A
VSGRPGDATREGIESTARTVREISERSGHPMSHEQARERVVEAVRQGDRKRDNGNR